MSKLFSASPVPTKSRLFSNDVTDATPIEEPSKGFLGNYADYAKGAALGIAQGLGDIGASVLNAPGDVYGYFKSQESPYHVPHPSLEKYYPKGKYGQIGSSLGELTGQLYAPGGVAFKVLKAFNNPIAKALAGSAVGAGLGSATNDEDRLGAGITGAALGLGAGTLHGLNELRSAPLARKILADKLAAKEASGAEYNKLFADALKRGLGEIPRPNINSENIIENSRNIYHQALQNFLQKPSVETGHWAQSDLGALERHLERLDKSRGLTSTEHKLLKDVSNARDQIKSSMFTNQLESHPDLAKRYGEISERYKKNVLPYEAFKSLNKFEEGKILPKDLIETLKNNKEFRATLQKKYPQININQLLKGKGAKYLGYGILGGLGFKEGSDLLK